MASKKHPKQPAQKFNRRIVVRAVRREEPDLRRIATALTELYQSLTPEQLAEMDKRIAGGRRKDGEKIP